MTLYNLALLAATPLIMPYLAFRLLTGKETAESLRQKFGRYQSAPPPAGAIWVHAVSVGETNAAAPLVEALAAQRPVVFSVSTLTGMEVAKKRLGNKVPLFFFPLDFPFAVGRALDHFRPSAVVVMETEIWPNFLAAANRRRVKTALVNGRISDRSFDMYRRLRPFLAPAMEKLDLLLMQTDEDRQRIVALGADPSSAKAIGNLKFDLALPDPASKSAVRREFGVPPDAEVVLFASTHPGEEEIFLSVCASLLKERPKLLPIVAPRHIHRAPAVLALCEKAGFVPRTRTSRREGGTLLLLDTIGELARLYGAADLAVMGGSFVPHGGQNPLEAAGWEAPIIFGPHMHNFREIAATLTACGAAFQVADAAGLMERAVRILSDPSTRAAAGKAGRAAIAKNGGALNKTAQAIKDLLE